MGRLIPDYPWWAASAPEVAFGASAERYLQVTKDEARAICAALPEETEMTNRLFSVGHLGEEQYGMPGRTYVLNASPEEVRQTTGALLRSFGPSHEVKIATVAVALHRWFPRSQEFAA